MTTPAQPTSVNQPGTHTVNGLLDVTGLGRAVRRQNPPAGIWRYLKREKTLFPHRPNIMDVKQWGVGDCYLLAALISILNMHDGPEIIMRMMAQDESGDIFIKLHDVRTLQPRILRYEKSVILSWRHAVEHLWVQMIEKAYADFVRGSYKQLDSGESSDCFKVLLGVNAEAKVPGEPVFESEILATLFGNLMNGVYKTDPRQDIRREVFGGDDALMTIWEAWNRAERKERWRTYVETTIGARIRKLTVADFGTFLTQESKRDPLDNRVKDALLTWLQRNRKDGGPNPLEYTADQLNVYRKIDLELRANRPVSAGTLKSDSKSSKETKDYGIAGGHAYAVLEVKEDEDHRRWIRVRNPWGESDHPIFGASKYGRAYDRVTGQDGKTVFIRKVVASAESWLHLEDFCNTFQKLYFTSARGLDGLATDMRSAPTIAEVDDVDIGNGRARSNAQSGARIETTEVDPGLGRDRGNAISGPPRFRK